MKSEDWFPRQEMNEEYSSSLHQRTDELYRLPDAEPDENGLIECPVIFLRDIVIFPRMISPIFVVPGPNLLAIMEAQHNMQTMIGLVQKDPEIENPVPEDFLPVGVELAVGRLLNMPDGNSSTLVQGRHRLQIVEFVQTEPFYIVRARQIFEPVEVTRQADAQMRTARDLFERCVQLDRSLPDEAHLFSINIAEPGWLADMIATALSPTFQRTTISIVIARSNRTVEAGQLAACPGIGCITA